MPEPTPPAIPPNQPQRWTEDEIFAIMSNDARRKIVNALARWAGPPPI